MKSFHLVRAAALVAMLSFAACGAANTSGTLPPTPIAQQSHSASAEPSTGAIPAKPLVTLTTRGGHCRYGACWSKKQIATDGTYHASDGTGASTSGRLDTAQTAALAQLVEQADFAALSAHPFTGTCPIAYDGQELVYTFHTAAGDRVLESCKVAIDAESPLFQAVEQALAAMN